MHREYLNLTIVFGQRDTSCILFGSTAEPPLGMHTLQGWLSMPSPRGICMDSGCICMCLHRAILVVFYFIPSLWVFQATEGWLHCWRKADSLSALQQVLGCMCLTTAESKTWKFLVLCEKILQAVRSMVMYWSHLYWLHIYRVSLNPWEPSAIHLLGSAGTSVPFGESLSEEQLVSASFNSPRACAWRTGPAERCTPAWVCTSQRSPELFPVVWSCVSGISSVLIAGGEETRSLQVLKLEAHSLKFLRNVEDIPTVLLLPIFHPHETVWKMQSCLHHFYCFPQLLNVKSVPIFSSGSRCLGVTALLGQLLIRRCKCTLLFWCRELG